MPRDVSGNYTLPVGNPVVDGTIIATSWANPTMSDIAVQLNNVLTRDGLLGPNVPMKFVDGSATAPGIAWATSTNTGWFKTATYVGFSWNGTQVAQLSDSGISVANGIAATAAQIELGQGRSADGPANIDLISTTGSPDYNFRIIRDTGTNGETSILHTGTGTFNITAEVVAPITFKINNLQQMQVGQGVINFFNVAEANTLKIISDAGIDSGYVEFIRPSNGVRMGYIGRVTPSTLDNGTINYVAGAHSFTGSVFATGIFSAGSTILGQEQGLSGSGTINLVNIAGQAGTGGKLLLVSGADIAGVSFFAVYALAVSTSGGAAPVVVSTLLARVGTTAPTLTITNSGNTIQVVVGAAGANSATARVIG